MRWIALCAVCACRAKDPQPVPPSEDTAKPAAVAAAVAPDAAPPGCPEGAAAKDCTECLAGSGASCMKVAFGLPAPSDKTAWYQRGCDGGDPPSCESLSVQYGLGDGVTPDYDKHVYYEARRLALATKIVESERARCGASDEEACVDAGISLVAGFPVPADVPAAKRLLVGSCDRKYARACMALSQDEVLPRAERVKYARAACTLGEQRTCGDLVGVFGDPPLAASEVGFARDQLDRMCRAHDATGCWVLAGVYAKRDHGKAIAAIGSACKLDPAFCEDRDRMAHGGPFLREFGPLPTLDVQPLIDAAKKERGGR